jgi:hypothetical protein
MADRLGAQFLLSVGQQFAGVADSTRRCDPEQQQR